MRSGNISLSTVAIAAILALSQAEAAVAQTPPTPPPAAMQRDSTVDQAGDKTGDKTGGRGGAVTVSPGTTGAMDKAVGGLATSADDVKAQTEGRPTAAEAGKGAKPEQSVDPGAPVVAQSPGTVGAAPGTTPPAAAPKK